MFACLGPPMQRWLQDEMILRQSTDTAAICADMALPKSKRMEPNQIKYKYVQRFRRLLH